MDFKQITSTAASLAVSLATLAVPGEFNQQRAEQVEGPDKAVAVLTPTEGKNIDGEIVLTENGDAVQIRGTVSGLEPGKHGFHIHEFGDLRDGAGKSAGGHYNPEGVKHGDPRNAVHHAGDLGNIEANASGVAKIDMQTEDFKLQDVVGRSIVVHGGADDFTSQPSGDAGPRVALGVIGYAQ